MAPRALPDNEAERELSVIQDLTIADAVALGIVIAQPLQESPWCPETLLDVQTMPHPPPIPELLGSITVAE